jgi:hypothetical protein
LNSPTRPRGAAKSIGKAKQHSAIPKPAPKARQKSKGKDKLKGEVKGALGDKICATLLDVGKKGLASSRAQAADRCAAGAQLLDIGDAVDQAHALAAKRLGQRGGELRSSPPAAPAAEGCAPASRNRGWRGRWPTRGPGYSRS